MPPAGWNRTDAAARFRSPATWQPIGDEFICEPGGTILGKGKGEIKVWREMQEQAG